jgi:hypothetical protein
MGHFVVASVIVLATEALAVTMVSKAQAAAIAFLDCTDIIVTCIWSGEDLNGHLAYHVNSGMRLKTHRKLRF